MPGVRVFFGAEGSCWTIKSFQNMREMVSAYYCFVCIRFAAHVAQADRQTGRIPPRQRSGWHGRRRPEWRYLLTALFPLLSLFMYTDLVRGNAYGEGLNVLCVVLNVLCCCLTVPRLTNNMAGGHWHSFCCEMLGGFLVVGAVDSAARASATEAMARWQVHLERLQRISIIRCMEMQRVLSHCNSPKQTSERYPKSQLP